MSPSVRRLFFAGLLSLTTGVLSSVGCATGPRQDSTPPFALSNSSDTIRVRILNTKIPARLQASGPFQFQLRKGGKIYRASSALTVRAMRKTLVFGHQSLKGDVSVVPVSSTDTLRLNGRRYRGNLVLHAVGNGRYDVVEYLPLETYLYGVLPREVGADWPLESLKAQAVVSRTYVLANRASDPVQRFDVFNEVKSQVYGGLEDEAPAANAAVDQTRGEILQDKQGNPIQTFFHSSCGGRTETPENVWLKAENPDVFASVTDDFCREDPYASWKVELKLSTLRARLRKAGYKLSDIKTISIGKKSDSGRAVTLLVYTTRGKTEIQGNRFRLAIGSEVLRSTLITSISPLKHGVRFEGRGWGHGVGLCQWGARGRALAGQNYQTILKAYYPKANLVRVESVSR